MMWEASEGAGHCGGEAAGSGGQFGLRHGEPEVPGGNPAMTPVWESTESPACLQSRVHDFKGHEMVLPMNP